MTSYYWGGQIRVEVGVVTEAFHAILSQLCICSYGYHCQNGLFELLQSMGAWIMGFYMASDISTDREQGSWLDPDKVNWCSCDHGHQHGFKPEHRQQISTLPFMTTQTTYIISDLAAVMS